MDALYREFGRRLKAEREDLDIRQETVAGRVGLSRASVANIEAGRQRFPFHIAYQLAAALGVDLSRLLPDPAGLHDFAELPPELLRSVPASDRRWVRDLLSKEAARDDSQG